MRINLEPHDPIWRRRYRREAERIVALWPQLLAEIHHIGSTSVPGLTAKPIVDILVAVWDLDAVDRRAQELQALDYENMGEYGIPGRRYFRKPVEGADTFHVHVFQCGHEVIRRHLRFRDYLTAHPEAARAYAEHKQELAGEEWESSSEYAEAKTEFIRGLEARALAWQRGEG